MLEWVLNKTKIPKLHKIGFKEWQCKYVCTQLLIYIHRHFAKSTANKNHIVRCIIGKRVGEIDADVFTFPPKTENALALYSRAALSVSLFGKARKNKEG